MAARLGVPNCLPSFSALVSRLKLLLSQPPRGSGSFGEPPAVLRVDRAGEHPLAEPGLLHDAPLAGGDARTWSPSLMPRALGVVGVHLHDRLGVQAAQLVHPAVGGVQGGELLAPGEHQGELVALCPRGSPPTRAGGAGRTSSAVESMSSTLPVGVRKPLARYFSYLGGPCRCPASTNSSQLRPLGSRTMSLRPGSRRATAPRRPGGGPGRSRSGKRGGTGGRVHHLGPGQDVAVAQAVVADVVELQAGRRGQHHVAQGRAGGHVELGAGQELQMLQEPVWSGGCRPRPCMGLVSKKNMPLMG